VYTHTIKNALKSEFSSLLDKTKTVNKAHYLIGDRHYSNWATW